MKMILSAFVTLAAAAAFANSGTTTGHTGKHETTPAAATTTTPAPGTAAAATGPNTDKGAKKEEKMAKVDCKDPKNKAHAECKATH